MAKKKIISDFSALKGKVSFSENSSDAMMAPKVNPVEKSHKAKTPDDWLKVGQNVVLMDSDLRGKIISLGKRVDIELENGLIINATYGEFAVTQDHEISVLKQTCVKQKKTASAYKMTPVIANNIQVDLHIEAIPGGRSIPKGQQLQFQMDTFRRIIRENLHHRGISITFIHGIGDGILKTALRKELDEVFSHRCSYKVGDPAVTIVSIK